MVVNQKQYLFFVFPYLQVLELSLILSCYTCGLSVVTAETKAEMKKILSEIQSGQFAREFVLENQAGKPGFTAMRRQEAEHPIEAVGKDLRAMFSWLKKA